MEKLKVSDLREELTKRQKDSKGNKSILMERLRDALLEEGTTVDEFVSKWESSNGTDGTDQVRPEDSASQVSASETITSQVSQLMLEKVRESARKAGLAAKASAMAKKHELLRQEMELKMKMEELELNVEMSEAEAREKVLAESETELNRMLGVGYAKTEHEKPTRVVSGQDQQENENPTRVVGGQDQQEHEKPTRVVGGQDQEPPSKSHLNSGASSGEGGDVGTHQNVDSQQKRDRQLARTLIEHSQRSVLPKVEIPRFGGDCTEFH